MIQIKLHQNPIARFWRRVNIEKKNECWEWTGPYQLKKSGYKLAKFTANNIRYVVAVFVWVITYGPVPKGKQVNHTCDNSLCCNPGIYMQGPKAVILKTGGTV